MPVRSISRTALGSAVRELRIERGLSQEAVADAAALHVTYLSGIERGLRNPSLDKLNALARALEISTIDLIRHADEADHTA